jgi:hypothetical protein
MNAHPHTQWSASAGSSNIIQVVPSSAIGASAESHLEGWLGVSQRFDVKIM